MALAVPAVHDAHRHLGVLPAYPFYGGPPVNPDVTARATIDDLRADLGVRHPEVDLVVLPGGHPDHPVLLGVE